MRNRPLKTFLTCPLFCLLLQFFVFASFTPQEESCCIWGRYRGNRIELHKLSFLEIDDMLSTSIDLLHADEFDTYRRGGVSRLPTH